jgi:transposase
VARKLAVIMHAMWIDGTFYSGDPEVRAVDVAARTTVKDRRLLGAYA